jgi:pimeloyl-ACP methyl ester carboxylesterase
MSWLKRPGCELYYEVSGSGPAIVFAHGLGGNHMAWWQQLAHFSPRYTCVTFSHRGFPPSGAVAGASAPDAYADDLAALIAELGLNEVRLVAQSMGGWTCLEYALREPGKVRALVMASTSGTLDFRQLKGPEAAEIQQWVRGADRKVAELEARGFSQASGARMHEEQPALAHLYGQISRLTPAEFRESVRGRIRAMRTGSPSLLAQLPMPVLFLTGDEDVVFPAAAGPGFAALAPHGRAARIPKAGHSVYFERAAEFNRIVEEFLA